MSSRQSYDRRSIPFGIAVGFVASLALWGVIEVLRQAVPGFADSGAESAVALLAIPCYFVAGWFSIGPQATGPGQRGALAGVGVALLGLSLSLLVWALFRGGSWLTGARADHPTVVVVGPILSGAAFGAIGAVRAARRQV